MKRYGRYLLIIAMVAMLLFTLSACGSKKQVAATVNGEDIYEDDVTAYVDHLRTYYGVTDDTSWAEFLGNYGYTASDIRDLAINALAEQKVIEQTASDNGITVSDDEIDEEVSNVRSEYGYTDDADWTNALTQAGYADENAYRDAVKSELLQQKLYDAEVTAADPTDEEVAQAAIQYAGEKASHIQVADEATADTILATLQASTDLPTDFATQFAANNTDTTYCGDGGDLGWTSVNYMVYSYYLSDIQTALKSMNKNDLAVVKTSAGYSVVWCTDVFTVPDGATSVDISTIPSDLLQTIKDNLKESDMSTAQSDYLQGLMDGADVQTNDMPSGLSYDIEATTSSSSTTGTTSDVSSTQFYQDDSGVYYYDASGNKTYISVTSDTTSGTTGSNTTSTTGTTTGTTSGS